MTIDQRLFAQLLKSNAGRELLKKEIKSLLGEILTPKLLREFPEFPVLPTGDDILPAAFGGGSDLDSYRVTLDTISDYIYMNAPPGLYLPDVRVILEDLSGIPLDYGVPVHISGLHTRVNKDNEWRITPQSPYDLYVPVIDFPCYYQVSVQLPVVVGEFGMGDHIFLLTSNDQCTGAGPWRDIVSSTYPSVITSAHTFQLEMTLLINPGESICFSLLSEAASAYIRDATQGNRSFFRITRIEE